MHVCTMYSKIMSKLVYCYAYVNAMKKQFSPAAFGNQHYYIVDVGWHHSTIYKFEHLLVTQSLL
jgi:hypothetical protein